MIINSYCVGCGTYMCIQDLHLHMYNIHMQYSVVVCL